MSETQDPTRYEPSEAEPEVFARWEAAGVFDSDADGDPAEPSVQRAVITIGGQPAEPEEDEDEVIKPLPERLITADPGATMR